MLKKKNIKATEDFALNKSKEQMELKTGQKAKTSVNAQKLFPKESHFMYHICGFMRKRTIKLWVFGRAAVNWIAWILQRANRWLEFHKLAEKPNFDQNGVRIIYFNLKVNWLRKVNDLYWYWTVNDLLTLNFLSRLNDSGNFHLVFSLRGKDALIGWKCRTF